MIFLPVSSRNEEKLKKNENIKFVLKYMETLSQASQRPILRNSTDRLRAADLSAVSTKRHFDIQLSLNISISTFSLGL